MVLIKKVKCKTFGVPGRPLNIIKFDFNLIVISLSLLKFIKLPILIKLQIKI